MRLDAGGAWERWLLLAVRLLETGVAASILIAEDGDGGDWIDGDDSCRQAGDNLVCFISPEGIAFDFARVPKTADLVVDDFEDF
jgi:hypothetical protein